MYKHAASIIGHSQALWCKAHFGRENNRVAVEIQHFKRAAGLVHGKQVVTGRAKGHGRRLAVVVEVKARIDDLCVGRQIDTRQHTAHQHIVFASVAVTH